jgi:hypothetical protein
LLLWLIASLAGLAIVTALLPYGPVGPAPVRSFVLPAPVAPAS